MAVAIVGGPLTMGFLSLEATGNLPMTVAVLAACVISSLTVRRTFGYSFATWRFHLRGETIRSAADVGWIRDLTVRSMMRGEVTTVPVTTPIESFRQLYPLGSKTQLIAIDQEATYAGVVFVADAYGASETPLRTVGDIAHPPDAWLLAEMNVRDAVALFDRAEAESLAVVDGPDSLRVIGLLTEAHALRRYAEESERHRPEALGDV